MSKKLFSVVSLSSMLLSGGAFSMESKDTSENVEFGGQVYPATPITKKKIEEFETQYPNTVAVKQKVRSELGDLSAVPKRLAGLMLSEKSEEALRNREMKRNEISAFLSERACEREFHKTSESSQQALEEQILLITSLTQTLKDEYSQKLTEISQLTESIQQYGTQMGVLESQLQESQAASSVNQEESEQIVAFYQESLLALKGSLAQAQEQLLNVKIERATLKHEAKLLNLQLTHNGQLLKAYSPLKKVVEQNVTEAKVIKVPSSSNHSAETLVQEDDDILGSDDEVDLDA